MGENGLSFIDLQYVNSIKPLQRIYLFHTIKTKHDDQNLSPTCSGSCYPHLDNCVVIILSLCLVPKDSLLTLHSGN